MEPPFWSARITPANSRRIPSETQQKKGSTAYKERKPGTPHPPHRAGSKGVVAVLLWRVATLTSAIQVTSEYAPAGAGLPTWLFGALTAENPPNVMVLHPNELHRQQTLEALYDAAVTVHPQHHLTLNRLIRLLHTDLRLPVLLDDDTSNFMALHARCEMAANDAKFPFLYTPGVGSWTMAKTKRIQHLHGELMKLRQPFAWQNDPGASTYHRLAVEHQEAAGGTLPSLVLLGVVQALRETTDAPFHLSGVDGLILLNNAPDYTELEQDLLLLLSNFRAVHQILSPGSFRLGHHGAYLVDEATCTTSTLPSWLPPHEVWEPSNDQWRTEVGEALGTTHTRITVDERRHVQSATITLVKAFKEHQTGQVLIIDGAVQQRREAWSKALSQIDLSWGGTTATLDQQPMYNAVLRAASLSQGMSAWALSSLQSLFVSTTLPFNANMFPTLVHPTQDEWAPRPHPEVLEDIARQFHVLGGPGAMARWLGVLSQARPSFTERHPEQKRQALEETQWWMACLLHTWAPLLPVEDQHLLNVVQQGCSTGDDLPMPAQPEHGTAWLVWLLSSLDHAVLAGRRAPYDAGLGTLQTIMEALSKVSAGLNGHGLSVPTHGRAFVEMLEHVGSSSSMNTLHPRTSNISVVTPEDALGCQADLVILAGLDVDAWSMRSPVVPWLDAQAQVELGMFQSDMAVRRGRHHLRHLLNAAPHVVVFDSAPEEGGGPSAPLAEWLSDVRRSNEWDNMRAPPPFLPEALVQGEGEDRRFHWVIREKGHGSWLTPSQYTTVSTPEGQRKIRHGHAGADQRQQLGMDLQLTLPYLSSINHPPAVFDSFEASIVLDRLRRQPTFRQLSPSETFSWDNREYLASTESVVLRPTRSSLKVPGSQAPQWPHLGYRPERTVSLTVDPRPLPPYREQELAMSHRFGAMGVPYQRDVWSPSRIEAWLKCPRQAWLKQILLAGEDEDVEAEDVDLRIRGQVIHRAEAALLEGHGVPETGEMTDNIQPLHLGPMGQGQAGWEAILAFLQREVAWLGRYNAVSIHRTRDLVDATPEEWQALQQGELDLPPNGRLARLLSADLALTNASPVAVEWKPVTDTERSVHLTVDSDGEEGFRFFGYADRVDVVALTTTQQEALKEKGVLGEASHQTPFPLDGTSRTAQRLVVIRDLKTVNGPTSKKAGLRHMQCLFEDVQLALYARAWEVLHPNDRVVGVGASEIGEQTTHYVELDSDLEELDETLSLGDITRVFPHHFPIPFGDEGAMTPFRRWMYERLVVAQRAISSASQGHTNPTPGKHCQYCAIAQSCGASTEREGGM